MDYFKYSDLPPGRNRLRRSFPDNILSLPFEWLDYRYASVLPVWDTTTQLKTIKDELRAMYTGVNATGGEIRRRDIITDDYIVPAAAFLFPGVRRDWMKMVAQARTAVRVRGLSRPHSAAFRNSEMAHGDVTATLIAGQWLHWVHEHVVAMQIRAYYGWSRTDRVILPLGYDDYFHGSKGETYWTTRSRQLALHMRRVLQPSETYQLRVRH